MFYFILLQRANNLFYCSHPYNCNIFYARLAGGRDISCLSLRVAFCVVYKIKV